MFVLQIEKSNLLTEKLAASNHFGEVAGYTNFTALKCFRAMY